MEALRRRLRSGTLPAELLKPGHGVVLRAGDRELTRDELRAQAERVAGGLAAVGVKAGERVGLYAATSLDWVIAYLGLQRAGAVLVPMNPDYHSAEAAHIVNDSEPAVVIARSFLAGRPPDRRRSASRGPRGCRARDASYASDGRTSTIPGP